MLVLLLLLMGCLGAGEARAQAEILISQGSNDLVSNGNYDFGGVWVGTPETREFIIRNTGTIALYVSTFQKTGTHKANFSYTTAQSGTILANGSTKFTITFTPSQSGLRTATLSITNTDSNENPFVINLRGTGLIVPEISVSQGGANMTDGASTVNFGSVNIGLTSRRTFTIHNAGLASLTGLSVSLSGSSSWTMTALNNTSLSSSQSTSFTVSFSPSSSFPSSASLAIYSDDGDENPFNISLTGTGVVPIINVEYPSGTPLVDDRGRDGALDCATPPSEPDLRISRIRLSRQQLSPLWRLVISARQAFSRLKNPTATK